MISKAAKISGCARAPASSARASNAVHLLLLILVLVSSLGSSSTQALTVLPQGQCADGQPLVQCILSPCSVADNPCKDTETCETNYCGSCNAVCKPKGVSSTVSCANRCPEEYASMSGPVCSDTSVTRETACDAVCKFNETVKHTGPCNGSSSSNSSMTTGMSNTSSDNTSSHGCVCIALFDPVCTVQNNTRSNECQAACVSEAIAYRGECIQDQGADQGAVRPSAVVAKALNATTGATGAANASSPTITNGGTAGAAASAAGLLLPGMTGVVVRSLMAAALLLAVL